MNAPNLKLKVSVDSSEVAGLIRNVQKTTADIDALTGRVRSQAVSNAKRTQDDLARDEIKFAAEKIARQRNSIAADEALRAKQAAEYARWWDNTLKTVDKGERERIARQRNSIALEEQMQAKRQQEALRSQNRINVGEKTAADTALRIQRQAAQAEAALLLDKFDRRIAVERAHHAHRLTDLKNNDAAQEAEIRRHNAVVSRISMDKANLPNTPFQQLLAGVKQGVGFQNGVGGAALMAGGAIGATIAFSGLTTAIEKAIDVSNKMNTVARSLKFGAGSAKAGAEELEFLRDESNRLGFSLLESAQSFAQLTAAARGTTLQGESARKIFTGITEASVTLGMSGEQTAGALNAIQQMISKGTVQSEELRGQLGERLPGAFQIAARAMHVTTGELGKMLEQGKVAADDFLPKFAEELHKTFGKDAVDASTEARQSIQKMNNVIMEGASAVGGVAVGAYGLLAKAFLTVKSSVEEAADAQAKFNEQRAIALSPELAKQVAEEKRMNAIKAEGLRLAKEAKQQEDMKTRGPSAAQSAQAVQDQKDLAKMAKEAAREAEASAQRQAEDDRDFKVQVFANQQKKIFDIAKAARKEQAEAVAEDERRTAEIYEARARVALGNAGGNPVAATMAKQAEEIAALGRNETAITELKKAHLIERNAVEKEYADKSKEREQALRDQKLQAVSGFFSGFAALTAQANMHNRSERLRWKATAIAEAVANTALGATKSLSAAPFPFNMALMAGTIAAGMAQINAIKEQHFALGTDRAPGGMALVGEQGPEMVYLPRGSQVKTASETHGMMGGGQTNHIVINLSGTATRSDANMVAEAVEVRLKNLARDMREITNRRITA